MTSPEQQSSAGNQRAAKADNIQNARGPSPSQPLTPSKSHKIDADPRRPRLASPQSALSRSTSRSSSFRGNYGTDEAAKRAISRLSKYAEVEDEGYDDVFVAEEEKRFGCAWRCSDSVGPADRKCLTNSHQLDLFGSSQA